MVCGWRADARPTARAARATARPVVRAVRACARPMARAARAARPVATGEVSGQRERRRTPCGEGGASVGAPDGDWRGRRERGGRQCKNRVLRQRSACALFPALHPISRPSTDIRHHARGGCGLKGTVACHCHCTNLRQLIRCHARDGACFGRARPSPLHKHHEAHNRRRLQVAWGPAPYTRHV